MEFITLKLNMKMLQTISAGLHELPGKICNPLLAEMEKQIAAQRQPVADEAVPVSVASQPDPPAPAVH